ncbi:MAG: putative Ig domain-containing protein, partial [Candidatus Methanoperedens sp.]
TGNGAEGYLNVSARMNMSPGYYDFEVDGIVNQTLLSGASGWVTFNYTGWSPNQHDFRIKRKGAPGITSWGNNKTNNDILTLTINISEAVNFNATANQSIDTWSWFKDNANQNNNYDNFTTGFNVAGIHTIKVNATNTNGTSNTLTWTVTVQALAVAPNITSWGNNKTNNNSQTPTINTSEPVRFNATANQSIDIWNWFKDDADQTNNYDNFTTNFTAGIHTIKVNATNNANGTSNTIVWTVNVQAIRGVSLTNISALSLPANAGTNATYILNLTNNGTDADSYNLTVDNPGAAAVGLNISAAYYFLNSGETKIFSLNVTGASAGTFKVNVTAASTNDTRKFAYVNTTTTVTIQTYIPPTPVILTAVTGNFWVNTTWQAGSGNVTDSYNSTNGTAWINSSLNYRNTTLSPHGWQNLTIYAWNSSGTGTLNTTPAQNSTQIPNNVPVLSSIGDKTVNENQTLSFTITATDLDGDTLTNGTNATKGSFTAATGTFTWTPAFGDAGTYVWYFNSTDNYSAVASETITVAVTNVPLTITSRSPDTDPTTIQGTSRSFNITLNRTANVIWYINGASVQTNNSVASALYTNSTAGVGIYNVTASVSDAFDTTSTMWNWTVNPVATYIPPTPVILTAMTGNFWVNTTWQAGNGNITNSYNVSVNGAWTNGTTNTYVNSTLSAHAWQNVSVYAWNSSGTGTLNITPAQNNTRIPNNVPVLSPIGSKTVAENQTLSFTISATDADGDTLTYGSNVTKGAFNTGTGLFTWTPGFVDSGTYVWYFNSSDGYGGVSSETVTITVNNIPLSITARTPGTDPATAAGTAQTFTVSLNRSATVTWYINGTSVQTNTSITYASYTNSTADAGIYNVTAIAQDTYDTASTSWTWTVSPVSIGAPSITSFAPTSPVSNTAGSSRTFNITVNQTVNVTWYINGTLNKSDTGVTDSSYTNTSVALGVWNVTAAANNANGAVSQQWIWNVTEAPTGVPSITSFAPTSPVSNTAGSSRTFNITVN